MTSLDHGRALEARFGAPFLGSTTTQLDLYLAAGGEISERGVVLVATALTGDGRDVTAGCDRLRWSAELGSHYLYAPSTAGAGIAPLGTLAFREPIHTLAVRAVCWPSRRRPGPGLVRRLWGEVAGTGDERGTYVQCAHFREAADG